MRRRLLQLIYAMTALVWLALPAVLWAAPVVVGTSTSVTATDAAHGGNRRTFYDDVHHTHWVAYYNGSAIEFAYTGDLEGGNWNAAGTLSYSTSEFAITFKTISGVPYIVVAAPANSYDIVLRRGVVGSTSIAFDAEVTALNGTADDDTYSAPSIALDGSNKLWVAAVWDVSSVQTSDKIVGVAQSSNSLTGNINAFAATTRLGKPDQYRISVSLLPKGGDNVYLLSGQSSNNLEAWEFDGSNWVVRNAGEDYSWFGMEGRPINETVKALVATADGVYAGGGFGIYLWDGQSWKSLGAGLNGIVNQIVSSGNDIYAVGGFTDAGGNVAADSIARWDGERWNAIGGGITGSLYCMEIVGGDIYVGGFIHDIGGNPNADGIVRWDGTSWHALGPGLAGTVYSIISFGGDIYAGGTFVDAGGNPNADRIARWNGASWSSLGAGLTSSVESMVVLGSNIYVGGSFSNAGGIAAADYIARWDGASWHALGSGLNNIVFSIAVYGPDIYVGGQFSNAGGDNNADTFARWDGVSWSSLGSGLTTSVNAISASNYGLYIGGQFTAADGNIQANMIASWNGSGWQALGAGLHGTVYAIAMMGKDVFIGGNFNDVDGNLSADYIARWDGSSWHSLGPGLNASVRAFAVVGGDLYVGGYFSNAGGIAAADYIVRWDGVTWTALGSGLDSSVYSIIAIGTDLYVGGDFNNAGGVPQADRIARWDGNSWHALGAGLSGTVYSLAALGSEVYAGGAFSDAGGDTAADGIARWDGVDWHAISNGLNGIVYSLAANGSDIYAGGSFTNAGGNINADRVARWDGGSWHALGMGVNTTVNALLAVGVDVYAGGNFWNVDANPFNARIIRWDGMSWKAVDSGLNKAVYAIAGDLQNLYVGGDFSFTGDGRKPLSRFAWYSPTPAADLDASSNLSATTDASGDLHLLYNNASDEVVYRKYDDGLSAWQASVVLDAPTDVDSLGIARTNFGNIQALWLEGNSIRGKSAESPYDTADWQVSADTFYNSGTNTSLSFGAGEQWGRIPYFWSSGGSSPYDVMVDYLDFTHSISGHIDNSGSGLENVTLDAGIHGSARTDSVGNYTISGIPWGMSYTVTPTFSDYSFSPVSLTGTVTADLTADFSAIADLATVAGVIEQNGIPVSGATVTIETAGGTFSTTTGSNGSYAFGGLAPGVGTISVVKGGVELVSGTVTVTPGATVVPVLDITDPRLPSSLYTFWNGFLEMVNVLELVNPGTNQVEVDVSLRDIDGGVVALAQFSVPAGSERDVVINDLPGFLVDSYGLVTVDAGSAEVDGRMTYYRLSGDSWGDEFDFVYSLELIPEMSGETTGVWNTYLGQQSSSSAAIFGAELELGTPVTMISTVTPNWLSIANLDNSTRAFTITWRYQTGDSIATTTLRIPPLGKRDIQAGHEFSSSGAVGLISITPENNSAPYIATVSRYGNNFAFAMPMRPGAEAETMLPAGGEGLNVMELANVTSATNNVQINWYDMNGVLLKTETAHLPPYSQQHFMPTDVLPEGSYGSVVITPTEKVIAGAASYLYDSAGHTATAHYLDARESFGKVLSGTYNTYLEMDNWLRLTNSSASGQYALIDFGAGDTTSVFIPAHGRRDVLIPTSANVGDSYGSFTLQSSLPGIFSASVVRRREVVGVDFQTTFCVR